MVTGSVVQAHAKVLPHPIQIGILGSSAVAGKLLKLDEHCFVICELNQQYLLKVNYC